MRIEIETGELTRPDALSLAVLVHSLFPDVLGQIALMANASHEALNTAVAPRDPAAVFGEEGAPSSVAPSAEDVFARPPAGAPSAEGSPPDSSADISPGSATPPTAPLSEDAAPITLDSDGVPWDARIHSGGKTLTQAGVWRARVGVGKDVVAAVKAELRAALAAGSPAAVPLAPPAPAIPPPPPATGSVPPAAPPPATPESAEGASSTIPAATSGTTGVPLPPDAAAAALVAAANKTGVFEEGQSPAAVFTGVMRHVTDGKFTPEEIGAACAATLIATPRELMAKPELAKDFIANLNDLRSGAGV